MSDYEEEVRSRWGDTDAYKQSTSRTSKYSKADFAAAKIDQEAATELFVYAFGNSLPIDSAKAKEAVV
ncbi:MAG: MerR family transcriptional regulator, partial [Actinobacteria bacterium]|nr:MerR family transcriptional regulator [Actinomycetota bacterium]